MTPLSLKEIQQVIARTLPHDVTYARKRHKVGKGKKKHTQLKTAGATDDRMFFIMCYENPVNRMEFMVPFVPEYISRTVAVTKAILLHFFPDWLGGDWLTETVKGIGDNQKLTEDYEGFKLSVSRLDVYNQKIIMFDIT